MALKTHNPTNGPGSHQDARKPILATPVAADGRKPLSVAANATAGHASGPAAAENLERLFAGILTGDVNASLDRVRYALQRTQEVADNVVREKHDRYAKTRTVSYTIQVIERDQVTTSVSRRQYSGRGWNGKHHFAESKRGGRVIHAARVRIHCSTESEI